MARTAKKAWLGIIGGLALTLVLAGMLGSFGWSQGRASRAHLALNSALDNYRQGNYDLAATLFQQAQNGQDDLTAAEKEDLRSGLERNQTALQSRQAGTEQVRRLEEMVQAGKPAEANLLLREVMANQFLTPQEKQKVQQLERRLGSTGPGVATAGSKADAKGLLAGARTALQQGDLDRAENLAREAEQASSLWSLQLWGDSPARVLKDIHTARVRQARNNSIRESEKAPEPGPAVASAPAAAAPAAAETSAASRPSRARLALNAARDCHQRGDYELAATFFQQAQAGQDDLSSPERQDLFATMQKNTQAQEARRVAGEQLARADDAMRAGQTQEAVRILQEAGSSPHLTTADRQRVYQLRERLGLPPVMQAVASAPPNTAPQATAPPKVVASSATPKETHPAAAPAASPPRANRSSRAVMALQAAQENHQRGNYELAATFLQQAQVGQDELAPAQKQDLAAVRKQNAAALDARKQAAQQLVSAEDALRVGRNADAARLVQEASGNAFLSGADRQKAQQLSERLRKAPPVQTASVPAPATSAKPPVPTAGAGTVKPPSPRASQALQTAEDYHRRGEYELAAQFLQQAQAGQNELTPAEKQNLTTGLRSNSEALAGRRQASEQLARAEEALRAGRHQDVGPLLLAVSANPFLASADRQRSRILDEQLRKTASVQVANATPRPQPDVKPAGPEKPLVAPAPVPGGPKPPSRAHQALAAAAECCQRGDYELAATLLQQAQAGQHDLTAAERQELMTNLHRTSAAIESRKQGASQLARADEALRGGRTGEAASLLKDLTANSFLTAADRQRVQQLAERVRPGSPPADRTANATPASAPKGAAAGPSESARNLLVEARKALRDNDLARAREFASQARNLKPDLNWWEDTPEKLLDDLQQQEARQGRPAGTGSPAAVAQGTPSPEGPVVARSQDPRGMLREARELFNAGKLEESRLLAQKAARGVTTRWGLFEDSPERLLQDVQKVQVKRDREESVRLLAEARKLLEKAKSDPKLYEEAERLAYQAERLHGPYSLWDLGDRPQKVLAEVTAARPRTQPKLQVPPPGDVLAMRRPPLPPEGDPVQPDGPPRKEGSSQVADASPRGPDWPIPPARTQPGPIGPPVDPNKQRAQQMLTEARRLQREGKLIEARVRVIEAQKLAVAFNPEEDRPERALLEMASLCEKQIENLLQEATDLGAAAHQDLSRLARAEGNLNQARQLAQAFGLDAHPIEARGEWLKQTQAKLVAQSKPMPPEGSGSNVPGTIDQEPAGKAVAQRLDNPNQKRGMELLDKARLELRSGQAVTARRLAEEVFSGPYDLQAEAQQVLRSIDVEEFNQRLLAANREFDAGFNAYLRRDFGKALAIFAVLDPRMLNAERQAKLRNVMMTPEMQPTQVARGGPLVGGPDRNPGAATPDTRTPGQQAIRTGDGPAGKTPPAAQGYAQEVNALQEVKFQQVRDEVMKTQREAMARFDRGDSEAALDMLRECASRLEESQLEPSRVEVLRRQVQSRLQTLKTLKAQQDFEKIQLARNESAGNLRSRKVVAEQEKQRQVGDLMKQYNTLFKEGKYKEAEMVAAKAHELDPDNTAADAAIHIARIQYRQNVVTNNKKAREELWMQGLDDAENEGPPVSLDNPLAINKERMEIASKRKGFLSSINLRRKTPKEQEIDRRLNAPITLSYKDTPLRQVIDDLHETTGLNVVADQPALEEEGINLDRPMSIKLENLAMKSALNVMLHQAHLTYVVKDDSLWITTTKHARGKLVQHTYPVADLVIPVENYTVPFNGNLMAKLNQQSNPASQGGVYPFAPPNSLTNGQVAGSYSPIGSPGSPGTPGSPGSPGTSGTTTRAPGQTIEDLLMKLIANTIAPQSWSEVGGPGTIDYFPLGMALVINQTPDVQEQIAELLESLRRLQDLEVAVEVRLVSLGESFYERIGVDFSMNIKTDSLTKSFEPALITGQFKPPGYVNDMSAKGFIAGLTPAGSFTSDLDIPIRTDSFARAIPPFGFGGFPFSPPDGGLALGLAFLNDIQVFMLMEAAQGDRRTNVMQAPRITMFNGQSATIQVNDQQFFVTSTSVVPFGNQLVFQPINQAFPIGVTLTVQPVVSADRRFVRMSLQPVMTNLTAPNVPLFPFTNLITPTFDGGAQGPPVVFTQYLQQPSFQTISVQTTVNVPDGGTVLLGGLKLMNEGRNEFGPPVLSKIPYINRLFRNVGYGRDTSTLMIMVTPRIIISSEEEERLTGVAPAPLGGGL